MSKRRVYKINPYRKYALIVLLFFLFIGIGFSLFGTNMDVLGTVFVKHYDNTLYGVIEKASRNGFAKKYVGGHQDSMNASSTTNNIYYYNASTVANANQIVDSFNVKFANTCWEMLRTTDNGGIRMIYNGEAVNNQCMGDRGTHKGTYNYARSYSFSPSYYYGDYYDYYYSESEGKHIYSLTGDVTTGEWSPSLVGKFTCLSDISEGCDSIYYITSYTDSENGYARGVGDVSISSIGQVNFNDNHSSLSDVGYMYNKIYPETSQAVDQLLSLNVSYRSRMSGTNFYFSDSIRYNEVDGVYELYNQDDSDVLQFDYTNTYESLDGYYTCISESSTTCSTAYYVVYPASTQFYYLRLSNGNLLNDVNFSIYVAENITDNQLINPIEIKMSDWDKNRNNYIGYHICTNYTSTICDDEMIISKPLVSVIYGAKRSVVGNYKYGKSVTYNNGQYTLTGDVIQSYDFSNKDNLDFDQYYYSCLSEEDTCEKVYYLHYYKASYNGNTYFTDRFFLELENGEKIQDAINNMLYADDVNTYSSNIKRFIDTWYKAHIAGTEFEKYVDDSVYCYDRTIDQDVSSIGVSQTYHISFDNYEQVIDFSCSHETDKYSVSNPKAKLTYPIALPTAGELNAWGTNSLRNIGTVYYTGSPKQYSAGAINHVVGPEGAFNYQSPTSSYYDVRPVITIKPGFDIISGDGSRENPYIVDEEDMP